MRFRKLRIAWSIVCGIICLLIIIVWIHGYWSWDLLFVRYRPGGFQFTSTCGRVICIRWWNYAPDYVNYNRWFTYKGEWIGDLPGVNWPLDESAFEWRSGWWTGSDRAYVNSLVFQAPTWFPTTIAALFTALPLYGWRPRFSLRALLIATTLVAVGLGLIVCAAR
jgi:hypothetical protein